MNHEEFLQSIRDRIDRLGLTADPEMDAEADRIAAKMFKNMKFTPLESKEDDLKETKDN